MKTKVKISYYISKEFLQRAIRAMFLHGILVIQERADSLQAAIRRCVHTNISICKKNSNRDEDSNWIRRSAIKMCIITQ